MVSFVTLLLAASAPIQGAGDMPRSDIVVQASATVRIITGAEIRFDRHESKGKSKPNVRLDQTGTVWFEFS